MVFALVSKMVLSTVTFHWYWYRLQKCWYCDNTTIWYGNIYPYTYIVCEMQWAKKTGGPTASGQILQCANQHTSVAILIPNTQHSGRYIN